VSLARPFTQPLRWKMVWNFACFVCQECD